jgi:hypothetical protein
MSTSGTRTLPKVLLVLDAALAGFLALRILGSPDPLELLVDDAGALPFGLGEDTPIVSALAAVSGIACALDVVALAEASWARALRGVLAVLALLAFGKLGLDRGLSAGLLAAMALQAALVWACFRED